MKTKWTKIVPENEGWFWIKFRGKHGITKKPGQIFRFKSGEVLISVGADSFVPYEFERYKVRFGPAIEVPE